MTAKLPKRPRDPAQLGRLTVQMAIGEVENDKDQVLAALDGHDEPATGRAKARAASQTPERRREVARKAAAARWGTASG